MSKMRVRITVHFVFCSVVFAFKLVGLLTVAAYIAAFSRACSSHYYSPCEEFFPGLP